ncbi:TRAP transporter small permease [Aquimarina sp. BL5]|nr:TRAP transporter small permease [Aquimarina sp. BL5]RKM91638.1 TRAP transporter small permease subunit [Aquimarina sp. BL5]
MLISVVWQVFSRYILKSPSTITNELSSFCLIWIGLLGMAYATGQKLHLAIDLIPTLIVQRKKTLFDGIVYGLIFLFAFTVMIIGGLRLCILSFQFEQHSAALHIPMGIVYLIIPVSGVLISYYCFQIYLKKTPAI